MDLLDHLDQALHFVGPDLGPNLFKGYKPLIQVGQEINSDFISDFAKLPFPSHLGKYIIKIGKISTFVLKYMKLGK